MGFGASMDLRADAKLQRNMRKLLAVTKDMRPEMKRVGVYMLGSVNKTFRAQGRPKRWKGLAESTKKRRAKIGKWPGRILDVHGASGLRGGYTFQASRDNVIIGTSVPYAAPLHFGAPSRNLSPRPQLGFLPQDKIAIQRIVADGTWRRIKRI